MKFKNMKIKITDEVHLKAVCEVLESVGYELGVNERNPKAVCTWAFNNSYDIRVMTVDEMTGHDDEYTLTDLLKMRDEMVKENAKH